MSFPQLQKETEIKRAPRAERANVEIREFKNFLSLLKKTN